VLGPLVLFSGLAFSPALASVIPALVQVFGGQQSARTIHFFAGAAVVIFLIVHVAMVLLTGFKARMRAMITGRTDSAKEIS
jgi:thiosulfate reductase cytochrome b subunit